MSPQAREVWIGLAEVVQLPGAGVLMDRNMAYVNVLALAEDVREFESSVEGAARAIGFEVTALEDPEPLTRRLQSHTVDADLLQLADEVRQLQIPRFGAFYTWTSED